MTLRISVTVMPITPCAFPLGSQHIHAQVSLPSSSLYTNIPFKPRFVTLSEDNNYLHTQMKEALIKALSFICIISAKNIFMG